MLVPAACDVRDFRDEVMALRLPLGEGVTGNVALTGRGEIVNSALDDPRAVQVPGTPVEQSSLLCVPLPGARQGGGHDHHDPHGRAPLRRRGPRAGHAVRRPVQRRAGERAPLRGEPPGLPRAARGAVAARPVGQAERARRAGRRRGPRLQQHPRRHPRPHPDRCCSRWRTRTQRRQLEVIERAALDGAQAVRRVQEFTRLRHDEDFAALDGDGDRAGGARADPSGLGGGVEAARRRAWTSRSTCAPRRRSRATPRSCARCSPTSSSTRSTRCRGAGR